MDLSAYHELYMEESNRYLSSLKDSLDTLAKDSGNIEALESAYLVSHSLKGMSATMNYETPRILAEQFENYFYRVKQGESHIQPDHIQALSQTYEELCAAIAKTDL